MPGSALSEFPAAHQSSKAPRMPSQTTSEFRSLLKLDLASDSDFRSCSEIAIGTALRRFTSLSRTISPAASLADRRQPSRAARNQGSSSGICHSRLFREQQLRPSCMVAAKDTKQFAPRLFPQAACPPHYCCCASGKQESKVSK